MDLGEERWFLLTVCFAHIPAEFCEQQSLRCGINF